MNIYTVCVCVCWERDNQYHACDVIQCVVFILNTLHGNGVSMCTLQQLICMRHRPRDRAD